MTKKKNNTTKYTSDQLFEKILTDKTTRKNLVQSKLEYFFPIYFHQYMKYEAAPFHKEMFSILEDESIKLAVFVAFRGSAKSTIITTAYVLWSILGVQKKKFIIICGQTELKARQQLMNIKNELLHNDLLKKDLGPFEEERNSLGNATALIIKKLNVKIMICSVEQSIRGTRHNEHRPDLIILDDVEDTSSVKTRDGRNKTFEWLTGEILPLGSESTRIIAVGNLLHEDSLLKRLQKKIEGGEVKSMNPVYREYPIIDELGNSLWPGRYPTRGHIEAEKEKIMDEIAWSREFLLKIISTTEQVVHHEWIQFYKDLPRDSLQSISIGIDLAVSQKESADYTAIVVGYIYGYGKEMMIYIQPYPINERVTFPVQVEYITSLIAVQKQNHSRVKLYIENVGYQEALVQLLESKRYDVEGVPSTADKTTRLRLTTPLIKEGRILFPEKGCEELLQQMTGFGKESHDDLVDAFSILVLKTLEHTPQKVLFGVGRGDKL